VRRLTVATVSVVVLCLQSGALGQGQKKSGPSQSIYAAARAGNIEDIQLHIARGTDLNKQDQYGYTPLKCAIESQGVEAVKVMLEAGASANAKDGTGATPLLPAALRGQVEVVRMLLAKGGDANAKDDQQQTALHLAVQMGHRQVVEVLVEAGADVNAEGRGKATPLSIAQRRRQVAVAEYLKQHGAKEPVLQYGDGYEYADSMAAPGVAVVTPAAQVQYSDIIKDPNAIKAKIATVAGLAESLKGFDANSVNEQRSWVQGRYDNRSRLIREVESQSDMELAFIKKSALAEKAERTAKAVDDLVAVRKRRYDLIGDQLRAERREMLESRTTQTRGRGRSSTRGGRSAYGSQTSETVGGAYGVVAERPSRSRRGGEPNEPPIDAVTAGEMQAWANADAADKGGLLDSHHKANLGELAGLHQLAVEEEAANTTIIIESLMLAREERVEKLRGEIEKEKALMEQLQERLEQRGAASRGRGTRGGYNQENQSTTTTRRGRRR